MDSSETFGKLKQQTKSYFLRGSLTAGGGGGMLADSDTSSDDDRNENWKRRRGFGDGGDITRAVEAAATEHSMELFSCDRNSPRRDRLRPMHAKSAYDGSVLCCNCCKPVHYKQSLNCRWVSRVYLNIWEVISFNRCWRAQACTFCIDVIKLMQPAILEIYLD